MPEETCSIPSPTDNVGQAGSLQARCQRASPDGSPAGDDETPAYCSARTLILGCGNIFFGDDGFGCELVEYLQEHWSLPEAVCLLDAGTGVRKLLFTLCLSPIRPRRILIVDAVDVGRAPGEWFELDPAAIPVAKLDDFSLHQIPTSNLLRELQQQTGVEVRVLACQTGPLPDHVCPGLSDAVSRAIPAAAAWVAREYFRVGRAPRPAAGAPARPGASEPEVNRAR